MSRPRLDPALDAVDLKILAALQRDGRTSKTRLAALVNLSPTPCGVRIQRLEKAGFIRGYHADVELHRLASLTRFRVTIGIEGSTNAKARRLEAALAQIPNIIECDKVLGDVDYILTVVARDVSHYQEIIDKLVSVDVEGISYITYPVSKVLKRAVDMSLLKVIPDR